MYKRHFTEERVLSKMFQILLAWPLPLSLSCRPNVLKNLKIFCRCSQVKNINYSLYLEAFIFSYLITYVKMYS